MNEIIITAKAEIKSCKNTGDIRRLSARLFRNINDKSKNNIFSICGELLEERMLCIAFDFAHRMKNQYDENTFALFEGWLGKKEPQLVFDYLIKNKEVMPRLSYRYALQKMDTEKKKILLQ